MRMLRTNMAKNITTEEFIERANKIHNFKYDYSKTKYIRIKDKVEIYCPVHGAFFQRPDKHLTTSGCKYCSNTGDRLDQNILKNNLQQKFPNLDFSKMCYKLCSDHFNVVCKEHGMFSTSKKKLMKFINFNGCPGCKSKYHIQSNLYTKTGWRNKYFNKKTYVYLILIKTPLEECLKIGITGNLKNRFRTLNAENVSVKMLNYIEFTNPDDSYDMEKLIFKLLSKYKIVAKHIFGGRTECFKNKTIVLHTFNSLHNKKV